MTKRHITLDEFRRGVNDLAARCQPCDLKDRVMRELRRNSDPHSSQRAIRRAHTDTASKWASRRMKFRKDGTVLGIEAFDAFVAAHPEVRKGPRPIGPRVFYSTLEDMGYTIHRQGSHVVIEDMDPFA